MTKYKYYGTLINLAGKRLQEIRQLGYDGHHTQFRIVCKAKSRGEANRIAETLGYGRNCFRQNYTSETGNKTETELCDKYGFIINKNGTQREDYIDGTKEILSI